MEKRFKTNHISQPGIFLFCKILLGLKPHLQRTEGAWCNGKMAGLRVFFDSFSQPSRAVLLLLHANKIQYEPKLIHIARGELATCGDNMIMVEIVFVYSQCR